MPISSLYSSILIVVRWADLVSGFFGTYNGTLRQSGSGDSSVLIGIFCTNLAFQDRTPSPLPSPVLVFSCRLEASARGRWHRAGLLPPSSGVPLSIPQKLLKHPRLHPLRTDAPFSGVPRPHPPHKNSTASTTTSTPGSMPPSSGVPRPHPILRTDFKKNLPHRHETPIFSFSGLPKKNKIYYTY